MTNTSSFETSSDSMGWEHAFSIGKLLFVCNISCLFAHPADLSTLQYTYVSSGNAIPMSSMSTDVHIFLVEAWFWSQTDLAVHNSAAWHVVLLLLGSYKYTGCRVVSVTLVKDL